MPPERSTQNRVLSVLEKTLGYRYLGNKADTNNHNIDETLLRAWLKKNDLSDDNTNKVLRELSNVAYRQHNLYETNRNFYQLLRYGVSIEPERSKHHITVKIIDWENPLNNDFAIAEEVTVKGVNTKRPDIVLYINGIAIGVIELKRSSVSVTEGIRQNLDNQKSEFIQSFFNTIQLVMAGNDSEGLRYGTIETKEKQYLTWKEVNHDKDKDYHYLLELTKNIKELADQSFNILDKHIIQLLNKERIIEIIFNFIAYDKGIKKLCRHNQYFGIKSAQDFIRRKEGGIVWHTQGSGKSLTMVWLAKWIREFNNNARVLIITDRQELDAQIEKVFDGVHENIHRTRSGKDLLMKLNDTVPPLMCSLIHKFSGKDEADEEDVKKYTEGLRNSIPGDYFAKGDIYVFVDECHRTQSGKLHSAMKQFIPNALFIGFTGTPLLKSDKQTSLEVFGRYIHTYKFNEAVADGVVLDLQYEARDIEQRITSMDKIDTWFEIKTKGLTDYAKDQLKQRWGTIKRVFSSKNRLEKIVADIRVDFECKNRLVNGKGNAILISDSIHNACRYYQLFRDSGLKECAIITSYTPNAQSIKGEGEHVTEKISQYSIYKKMLADYFHTDEESALQKKEDFELEVTNKFINEPGQMKLLIVVNKLLTGFDAPPATYLYIDRTLKDHGLFQAVCRVNRLDSEDKEYGYIIDYKDLFKSLQQAFTSYTTEAFSGYDANDIEGLLQNRLQKAKDNLDQALETIFALVEPVKPPQETTEYFDYFCGASDDNEALKETEHRRHLLYRYAIGLLRAYTNIADEMEQAGYTFEQISSIKDSVHFFDEMKKAIQLRCGEYVDLKEYEASMRFLIDSYIGAEESRVLGKFDDKGLVEILLEKGELAVNDLPRGIRQNKRAVAETIAGNIQKIIIEEMPSNPMYYEKMSVLLHDLLIKIRQDALDYEEYLKKFIELAKQVKNPGSANSYPEQINTKALRALYDNLDHNEELTITLHEELLNSIRDDWRNNTQKTRAVKNTIRETLSPYIINDSEKYDAILEIIKNQREEY